MRTRPVLPPTHRRAARAGRAWALALLVAASVSPARAQDAERVPPRLLERAQIAPPAELADRVAAVTLEIVVSAEGVVTEARVVESAGEGLLALDALAIEAARASRFEPARVDGRAVPARIRIEQRFGPAPQAGALGDGGDPLEGPETAGATALEDAARVAPALATPGLAAPAPSAPEPPQPEPEGAPTFRARASVEPTPRDATRRVIPREMLTTMPGTRGDALRAVELLPGVARPIFGIGALIVRGSAPGDSQVFLDGNPVPLVYHFGGLTSFYNSQLLERIELVPGNFSVRYGRRIGGILEVEPRDPRTDGYHGMIDVSAIDASIVFEGPIGDRAAIALAFRRSLIDLVLAAASAGGGLDLFATPAYYDYQAIATWNPTDADRIRLLAYGSVDTLQLAGQPPEDANLSGDFGLTTQFHRLQIGWRHREGDAFQQDVQLGLGIDLNQIGFGDFGTDSELYPINLRAEWRLSLSPDVHTIIGIDTQLTPYESVTRLPPPRQTEGLPGGGFGGFGEEDPIEVSSGIATTFRPAVYAETDVELAEIVDLSLGIRGDWYSEIQELTADPRLVARVGVTDWLAIRAGVGLFSQAPELSESGPLGNAQLEPLHALHIGLGTDVRLRDERFTLSIDGYYKHVWDRVVGNDEGAQPRFVNGGLGRIYGLELSARLEPGGPIPLYGFLSYTLSRSERQDGPDLAWRLFDFDQTHILSLAVVWRIGRGWEAGATFRLVSGNPLTPVAGAVFDVRRGVYEPVYGAVNSDRNPLFHRLDVRLSKRWDLGDVRLTLSIDIQNVYNQANREGVAYSYDYSESTDITGLPIIPSIGLRGEL